jgi:hypothetical protein
VQQPAVPEATLGPVAPAETDVECGHVTASAEAADATEASGAPAHSPAFNVPPSALNVQSVARDASSRRESGDGCDTGAGDAGGESSGGDEDEAAGVQPPVSASM